MKKIILAVLFVCVSATLCAQYNINYGDDILTKKERKKLEQAIDYQLRFYTTVFPDKELKASSVNIIIHTNPVSYYNKQRKVTGRTIENSFGFYSASTKEVVVLKDKKRTGNSMQIFYHEVSHFFINTYSTSIPVWLNEGLATYFEHIKIGSKKVEPRRNKLFFARVKTMIDTHDLDLSDFMVWNHQKFNTMSFSHDSYGYALGHSLVWFMMEKEPHLMVTYMQALENNTLGQEAIETLYEGGFKKFEQDFVAYISKD